MKTMQLPAVERIKELLNYFPETGVFEWKTITSNCVKAGSKAGGPNTKGYFSISIEGRAYKSHRLAWLYVYGEDPGGYEIDHIDLDKAVLKGRATWCCAKCGRDFSLEYLFWAEAAHPEWFEEPKP